MKKILIALLTLALILEVYLAVLAFFSPAKLAASINVSYSNELAFPLFLVAWFLLLIVMLIGYLIFAVSKDLPGYKPFIYLLSAWWMAIGIAIYLYSGSTSNLLSDSLKGILLIIVTASNKK